jgi:hypothetical protein
LLYPDELPGEKPGEPHKLAIKPAKIDEKR